jgi:hypothetical protein
VSNGVVPAHLERFVVENDLLKSNNSPFGKVYATELTVGMKLLSLTCSAFKK